MQALMPARTNAGRASLVILVSASILLSNVGCGSNKKSPAEVAATPAGLNRQNLQKLTPQQVDQRIQEVQANSSIPDSAKPNIIDSIRAQGQP